MHQALNEIGRVHRTIHILRTIDEEDYRRRRGRELNKGEAAHDLSRFLFFGKPGELRGRSFDDQFRSFSCLGVLHCISTPIRMKSSMSSRGNSVTSSARSWLDHLCGYRAGLRMRLQRQWDGNSPVELGLAVRGMRVCLARHPCPGVCIGLCCVCWALPLRDC